MSNSWEMKQGPGFAPAYQVSGTPFVKTISGVGTSPIRVEFPYVSRWVIISIHNSTHVAARIGFSENGVNSNPDANYYLLETEEKDGGEHSVRTSRLELRCKEIFIRTDSGSGVTISIIAGLTGIESFPVLTGSNGFKGIG